MGTPASSRSAPPDAAALHAAVERLEILSAGALWIELVRDATPPCLIASYVRGPRAGARLPFHFDDEPAALRIIEALEAGLLGDSPSKRTATA